MVIMPITDNRTTAHLAASGGLDPGAPSISAMQEARSGGQGAAGGDGPADDPALGGSGGSAAAVVVAAGRVAFGRSLMFSPGSAAGMAPQHPRAPPLTFSFTVSACYFPPGTPRYTLQTVRVAATNATETPLRGVWRAIPSPTTGVAAAENPSYTAAARTSSFTVALPQTQLHAPQSCCRPALHPQL